MSAGQVTPGGDSLLARIERTLTLTPSGLAFLALVVLGWVLARVVGSVALFRLVYGAVLVFGLAWLASRRRIAADATRSEVVHRMREGQPAEVEVRLTAKRRISGVILEDRVPAQLGQSTRVPVPSLAAGRELAFSYSFAPRTRGVYQVGPLEASWTDPFGLIRNRMTIAEPLEVIVHPTTQPAQDRIVIREWEDPPVRPPVSKPWPTGFEFYGMREYSRGDDPRRIVWRATARTLDPVSGAGRYLVREAEQGVTDRVLLLLDTNAPTHSGGEISETFEMAVRVIASLGVRHLHDGISVTVEKNSGRLTGPLRGRSSELTLLDELARVTREPETVDAAVERLVLNPRRDLHNVVVTANLDYRAALGLKVLIDSGASVLLVLIPWEDTDPDAHHRAAALGCSVVEVTSQDVLSTAFRKLVQTGAPR